MSRTLTANVEAKIAQNLGVEPIIIVKIEWESGTVYYADKALTIGAITCKGSLVNFSSVSTSETSDSKGEISNISLVLSDYDGTLKTILNVDTIEHTKIKAYHYFSGNVQADLTLVFTGKIVNPVTWSEGTRELSIQAESVINSEEVGFAPDEQYAAEIDKEAIGQAWPLCFGTPLHVPAALVLGRTKGTLQAGINQNYNSFVVVNGTEFVQDTAIEIMVGNIIYGGSFSGNVFTVTDKNKPYHTNIALADRVILDEHYDDPRCIWLATDDRIAGLYCLVNHPTRGYMCNYCVAQNGNQAFFKRPWRVNDTLDDVILNSDHTIEETAPVPRAEWSVTFKYETNVMWGVTPTEEIPFLINWSVISKNWVLDAGTPVKMRLEYAELYVANLLPSNAIVSVYAWRTTDEEGRIFSPVPTPYYTVNLSDTLCDHTPTTIALDKVLSEMDEGWEDGLYVTVQSTKGTNVANIIKYIIETYTDLTIDSTTYNSVRPKVGNFRANFALLDTQDAIRVCEDIAWQSRMAILIRGGIVYFKYLSEDAAAVITLQEDDVELKTLTVSNTRSEDIFTKITATYRKDYSGREESEKKLIYENNVDKYSVREREIDFYIYNVEEYVKLSLYWWGYQYSNSWRQVALACFLRGLAVETFDNVNFDIAIFSTNTIKGRVIRAEHNSDDQSILLEAELASAEGDHDGSYQPNEDDNYWTGDPTYPVDTPIDPYDPSEDLEEIDELVPPQAEDPENPDWEDSDGGPTTVKKLLKISMVPSDINRDTYFSLRVEAQDGLGNIINENVSATIQLTSTDGSDSITLDNIELVGGRFQDDNVEITGGTGSDTGTITAAAAGYENASVNINIYAQAGTLTWYTSPVSATRETVFDVAIIGGTAALVLDVELASTDPNDKLYNTSGEVTQITLDGSGQYTASDWYVKGGSLPAVANMTLKDDTHAFDNATCDQYPITGHSIQSVSNKIIMSGDGEANKKYIIIAITESVIRDNADFEITCTYKNADGTTDTSFNGQFRIKLEDADGAPLTFIDAGSDAEIYGSFMLVTATNGVWTYEYCKANIPSAATSPAIISAGILGEEYIATDTALINIEELEATGISTIPTLEEPIVGSPEMLIIRAGSITAYNTTEDSGAFGSTQIDSVDTISGVPNVLTVNSEIQYVLGGTHIYKSIDGGTSWSEITKPTGAVLPCLGTNNRLIVLYNSSTNMYAAYKDVDGSWVTGILIWDDPSYGITPFSLVKLVDGTLVAIGYYSSTYKVSFSTDNGVTWSTPTAVSHSLAVAFSCLQACANGNLVGIVTTTGRKLGYSTDGGENWTASSIGAPNGSTISAYGNRVLANTYNGVTYGISYSTDGGATWNDTGLSTGGDSVVIASAAAWYYIKISDKKIYKSTDGTTWNLWSTAFTTYPEVGKILI